MKEIKLTQGMVTLVDEWWYERLSRYKWYAHKDSPSNNYYAVRGVRQSNGKYHTVSMSRLILGLEYGDKRQADHISHQTLDNREENLRIATRSQNAQNRRIPKNYTSIYKGVGFLKPIQKWRARIKINGKHKHLGVFKDEVKSALAYDKAAIKYFGEFASPNF